MLRTCLVFLLAAAIWIAASPPAWSAMQLAIIGGEPERELVCLPVEPGTTFHLEFINSIYLAKVRESFEFSPKDGISLVSVESPSFGVFEYYGIEREDGPGKSLINRHVGEM
ncbi:MAG: hypothetical protein PHN75_12615, partial [Syntrophales bacterium]|nr:hypothetical protein [Syntrophales bacterium]